MEPWFDAPIATSPETGERRSSRGTSRLWLMCNCATCPPAVGGAAVLYPAFASRSITAASKMAASRGET